MKSYTVHRFRRAAGDPATEADATVFVKEGFCWPALFVPVLWLIYRQMWLVLVGFVAAAVALTMAPALLGFGEEVGALLAIALQVALATEGNDLRRWTLHRRSRYELAGLTYGPSLFEAELRYFRDWVDRVTVRQQEVAEAEAEVSFRAGPVDTSGAAGAPA